MLTLLGVSVILEAVEPEIVDFLDLDIQGAEQV